MTKFITTLGFIIIFSLPLLAQNNILATATLNNTTTISCQYFSEIIPNQKNFILNSSNTLIEYRKSVFDNINLPLSRQNNLLDYGPLSINSHNNTIQNNNKTVNGSKLITNRFENANKTPAPTGNPLQTFCNSATVTELKVTGTNIQYYAVAKEGSPVPAATALENGKTYYATQTVSGIESSSRLAITVLIIEFEIIASTKTVCAGSSVNLSVNHLNSKYGLIDQFIMTFKEPFNHSVPTAIGQTYSMTVSGTWDHYYDPTGVGKRDAAYKAVDTSNPTANNLMKWNTSDMRPSPNIYQANHVYNYSPLISNSTAQVFAFFDSYYPDNCGKLTVTIFSNPPTYLWSTGETTATITQTPTTTTKYWVDATLNGITCRKNITIITANTAEPTGNPSQKLCNTATILDLQVKGTNVQWYVTATGGSPLANATRLVDRSTYYASQTVKDCESASRLPVTVLIYTPQNPIESSVQTFCNSATIANLQATGTTIQWYSSLIEKIPLLTTTALVNGSVYYASQTSNGCESKRAEVTVQINKTVAPNAPEGQTFCLEKPATIADILIDNPNSLIWFDAASDGNILPQTTVLQNGEIVFVATYNPTNNCYSARKNIKVTVIPCQIEINNLLTLNGNDENSQLNIKNVAYFPKNQIKIYNRYGKQVWSGANYNNTTNAFVGKSNVSGVYKAEDYLPTGTYYYVFTYFNEYRNTNQESEGFIYINNNQ